MMEMMNRGREEDERGEGEERSVKSRANFEIFSHVEKWESRGEKDGHFGS